MTQEELTRRAVNALIDKVEIHSKWLKALTLGYIILAVLVFLLLNKMI